MISPCAARSSSMSLRAAGETVTRPGSIVMTLFKRAPALEEAQRLGAVADQNVLRLLGMVEHHRMSLSADSGLLVAAEGCMRRIRMIAIGPDPACLDAAAETIGGVQIPGPRSCAQSVQRVIGDFQRLLGGIEDRYRHHRPEDLLLEHSHFVVPFEHGRLDVVAARKVAG